MDDRQVLLASKFLNKRIVHIDAKCINVIHFTMDDGSRASIGAEHQHCGIPIVQVEEWDTVPKKV
jgi:hypothetical protein